VKTFHGRKYVPRRDDQSGPGIIFSNLKRHEKCQISNPKKTHPEPAEIGGL